MHADDEDFKGDPKNTSETLDEVGSYVALDEGFTLGSRMDSFTDLPGFSAKPQPTPNEVEPIDLSLMDRIRHEVDEGLEEFKEMTPFSKSLYILEYPFTIARRFSVPITAEDNYKKPWLLLSVALMPLWFFGYYLDLADYMIGATVHTDDDDDDGLAADDYTATFFQFLR